ncbi:MAG: phage portal protein [Tepidisphaeraceae bacterium]
MPYQLPAVDHGDTVSTRRLDTDDFRKRIERLLGEDARRYARLWAYYRNPMTVRGTADLLGAGSARPYSQAQEWGLPARITGVRRGADISTSGDDVDGPARKEVVIENDIAWRVDTMIDYLFGQPIVIESAAPDPARRRVIGHLLRLMLAHNGGVTFLQQLALLGAVYGFVDVLVKLVPRDAPDTAAGAGTCATQPLGQPPVCDRNASTNPSFAESAPPLAPSDDGAPDQPSQTEQQARDGSETPAPPRPARFDESGPRDSGVSVHDTLHDALARVARMVRLEVVEPARALPLLAPTDWRAVDAYAQCYMLPRKALDARGADRADSRAPLNGGWFGRFLRAANGRFAPSRVIPRIMARDKEHALVVELITPTGWQRYEDQALVASGRNALGKLPLVHIQNTAVPFEYAGASDVEPLVPLQDELNTRLSDRAHRITMQSFKMYLGKNIEGFNSMPVAPGRMWATDNDAANVIEFGGDASCPSEDAHIGELREALDKTSGVTPIAAGAIKGRIGRLTSAAALRVTMLALLARTEKKRTTYGTAIARMCELALEWLDAAGVFRTSPHERAVELHWPHPIPENDIEKLQEAEAKARLGVPREVLLRELGY